MTFQWRVEPEKAVIKRFNSYGLRRWPVAHIEHNGILFPVGRIECRSGYSEWAIAHNSHDPLFVRIAVYKGIQICKWIKLAASYQTLQEAQDELELALLDHPNYLPQHKEVIS